MKILPVIITTFALLVSCDKSAQSTTDTASSATKTAETTPANAAPAANTNTGTAATNSAKPALNPAHGEPYHRCEIAVGAPIDSQPEAQNAAPQVVQQGNAPANTFNTNPISPTNVPSAAPVTATGPKPALNPAHGEPHHRCDLQVGAPLT